MGNKLFLSYVLNLLQGFSCRDAITEEEMICLARGEKSCLAIKEKDVIRRDLPRMKIFQLDEAPKTLKMTAGQKRIILNDKKFHCSTLPFGFHE